MEKPQYQTWYSGTFHDTVVLFLLLFGPPSAEVPAAPREHQLPPNEQQAGEQQHHRCLKFDSNLPKTSPRWLTLSTEHLTTSSPSAKCGHSPIKTATIPKLILVSRSFCSPPGNWAQKHRLLMIVLPQFWRFDLRHGGEFQQQASSLSLCFCSWLKASFQHQPLNGQWTLRGTSLELDFKRYSDSAILITYRRGNC